MNDYLFEFLSENAKEDEEAIAVAMILPNLAESTRRNLVELAWHAKKLYATETGYSRYSPKSFRSTLPGEINLVQRMFVYTNIIEGVEFNDGRKHLIKMVNTQGTPQKTVQENFLRPVYHPVKRGGKIALIHVYITDESGDTVPFHSGTVVLTLHFRRVRKWR